MINRVDLKTKAKVILKKKYFYLLLVTVLFSFCIIDFYAETNVIGDNLTEIYYVVSIGFLSFVFDPNNIRIVSTLLLLSLFVRIFLTYPMEYSTTNYYKRARNDTEKGTLANGYKDGNLKRCIITFLYRDVLILLWGLLLIVPGIIKMYEYQMVPYLLEDYPDKTSSEILQLSKNMMYGNKKDSFVLDLSFFGWFLLSGIVALFTFGIGAYLVMPYKSQTEAELYVFLKEAYENKDAVIDTEIN